MFITLQDGQNSAPPDIYLYSAPQQNLEIPSAGRIYGTYALNLLGSLALFYLLLNQVVKVKRD